MYNTQKLLKQIIATIEKKELLFIQDVCAELNLARVTFYKHFPIDSEDYQTIGIALNKNKSHTKKTLRNVFRSTLASPAERMFLYKLLACEDEKQQINPVQEIKQIDPPKHEIILVEEKK
tara:strand:+ start:371 stop:730 length:360 start_codon:yes stop_codon:yes gene_type:complete